MTLRIAAHPSILPLGGWRVQIYRAGGGRWTADLIQFVVMLPTVGRKQTLLERGWTGALLFVALAKLGEVFGLLAELRFWVTVPGALPPPFDGLCAALDPDGAVQVLNDWRMERGLDWADVMPRLKVIGPKCRTCDGVAAPYHGSGPVGWYDWCMWCMDDAWEALFARMDARDGSVTKTR